MSQSHQYPWFAVVRGDPIEQGDLLRGCPRFYLPATASGGGTEVSTKIGRVDAVILTQSCDLAVRSDGESESS
jgi:hypothetical protein